MIDQLYEYANFMFSIHHDHSAVKQYMDMLLNITAESEPRYESIMHGSFVLSILTQEWTDAHTAGMELQQYIFKKYNTQPRKLTQSIGQLMYTFIFVYFNHPDGIEYLADNFFTHKVIFLKKNWYNHSPLELSSSFYIE